MAQRRWTPDEQRHLVAGAGAFAFAWFQKRVGQSHTYPGAPQRSKAAIKNKARALWGRGGLTRGSYSYEQLKNESGYSLPALKRAASALNHSYKRLSPRGPYMISEEQRDDLYAWLAHDFWSKHLRLYNCVWCHETERRHKSMGLCGRCYFAHRRLMARIPPDAPWAEDLPENVRRRMERHIAPPRAVLEKWAKDSK